MPRAAGGDSGGAGAGGALDGSSEAESERVRASRRTEEEIGGREAMTWAMFYLVCFLVGVTLSVLSFLSGSFHLPHLHLHLPHGSAHAGVGGDMPFLNFGTIAAFQIWSDAQRAVVPQRKLSPAPPPSSLAAWQRARRRWRRYAVPELRHDCGVSSVVWGSRVPADALLLTGSRRSADAGHRRRAGGRADRLLVYSQAAAQARS